MVSSGGRVLSSGGHIVLLSSCLLSSSSDDEPRRRECHFAFFGVVKEVERCADGVFGEYIDDPFNALHLVAGERYRRWPVRKAATIEGGHYARRPL